jgi:dipeptidyl aminopeptidase/acylaminoacyl peptidase
MDAQKLQRTLQDVLRETLDAEHGPDPAWADAPAARRVTEPQRNLWPLRAFSAAAAVLVMAVVGYPLIAGGHWLGGFGATQSAGTAPPFGPAGNGVIAMGKDGDILVADRPGGELRPLVAGPEDDGSPMFSPDGTKLAFLRQTGEGDPALMLADADGTDIVQFRPAPLGYLGFAPDGRSLLAVEEIDHVSRVVVRPVDPAAAPTVLDIQLDEGGMVRYQAGPPSFNPTNSQEILVVGKRTPDAPRGIYVFDLATGEVRTIRAQVGDEYLSDVAWLPDGRVTYGSTTSGGDRRVVAADGSGDQAFDALRGGVSPLSNDGTRIVAERDGEDDQTARTVIIQIDGDGEPVVIACGPTTDIQCPRSWIWSPDDSMLLGISYPETWSSGVAQSAETYQLVDAHTGQVTELDWRDVGTPVWQRVAP